MPFGLTWSQYWVRMGVSFLAAVAGSKVMHAIYKPDLSLNKYVEEELQRRKELELKEQAGAAGGGASNCAGVVAAAATKGS